MADGAVSVTVNGDTFDFWQDMYIRKSMLEMTPSFEMSIIDLLPGQQGSIFSIKMEDEVSVKINDNDYITGIIEDISIQRGWPSGGSIEFGGRGKCSVLIDGAYDGDNREWKNQTIEKLIKNICDYYDIESEIESSVSSAASEKIDTFKIEEGQTGIYHINKLCSVIPALAIENNSGKLVITREKTEKVTDDVVAGRNTDWSIRDYSNKDRFKKYVVKGQGIGGKDKKLSDWTEPIGEKEDSGITKERTCFIYSDFIADKGKCKNLAKWTSRMKAGISRQVIYTLPSWYQEDGSPWDINQTVFVIDDDFDVKETMLIGGVELTTEKGRMNTNLTLYPTDTFSISDSKFYKTSLDN